MPQEMGVILTLILHVKKRRHRWLREPGLIQRTPISLRLSALPSTAHDLIQSHLWFQPSYPHPRKGEMGIVKPSLIISLKGPPQNSHTALPHWSNSAAKGGGKCSLQADLRGQSHRTWSLPWCLPGTSLFPFLPCINLSPLFSAHTDHGQMMWRPSSTQNTARESVPLEKVGFPLFMSWANS